MRTVEHKGAVDLVTEADRASEALLVERLGALLPEASILAEEGSDRRRSPDLRWVVDPLDGTTNFAHGYPLFCVSDPPGVERGVGAGGGARPHAGGDLHRPARPGGVSERSTDLRVSDAATLDDALLVTGFPYDVRTSPRDNLPQFAAFLKRARAVRRDGTAALNLAYVAAGRFDGFWEEKLAPGIWARERCWWRRPGERSAGIGGEELDPARGSYRGRPRSSARGHAELLRQVESDAALPPVAPRKF